tara:strand:+ start:324 stop:512 length:189 start_codon:yes stop_codon:yes gene_type:complete
MIYKFKKWVILPAYAEVVIKANTDEEALKIINNLDGNSLTWQEAETVEQRTTYEVIDERSSD